MTSRTSVSDEATLRGRRWTAVSGLPGVNASAALDYATSECGAALKEVRETLIVERKVLAKDIEHLILTVVDQSLASCAVAGAASSSAVRRARSSGRLCSEAPNRARPTEIRGWASSVWTTIRRRHTVVGM
jgi:hypothetical protein